MTLEGLSVDGSVLATGDRILLMGQQDGKQNGIWIVSANPQRAADCAIGDHVGNTMVYCTTGNKNGGLTFVATNSSTTDVVGTDPLIYTSFSGNGSPSAGTGLSQQGSSISLNVDSSGSGGLQIVNNVLQVSADQPLIRTLGGLNELTIQNHVTAGLPPTSDGHLANKLYVDTMAYLRLGSGLFRDTAGTVRLSPQISVQDVTVSGHIHLTSAPVVSSHAVNKGYLSSLQWLNVDGSLQKDSASQTLKISASQPTITTVGTLLGLSVQGSVACSTLPTLGSHLVNKAYVDTLGFIQTGPGMSVSQGRLMLSPVQSFTDLSVSYNVTAAAAPTLSTHLTNRAYVDAAVAARIPSSATHAGCAQVASGKLTFSAISQQTQAYPQDVVYQRNSSTTGDTWTVRTAGIYAITATLLFTNPGTYGLVQNGDTYLWKDIVHNAGYGNFTFVGYISSATVLCVQGPSVDSTSVLHVSRL